MRLVLCLELFGGFRGNWEQLQWLVEDGIKKW